MSSRSEGERWREREGEREREVERERERAGDHSTVEFLVPPNDTNAGGRWQPTTEISDVSERRAWRSCAAPYRAVAGFESPSPLPAATGTRASRQERRGSREEHSPPERRMVMAF